MGWGFRTPGVGMGSVLVLLVWAMGVPVSAQPAAAPVLRPVPGPVIPPPFYRAALARGTRSADGRPGTRYWRNHARYDVRGELDPTTAGVTGSETIVYQNNSPDTLELLVLHLHLNIHKDEAIRNEPEEITDGMVLRSLTVDGVPVSEGSLAQPLGYPRDPAPGATAACDPSRSDHRPRRRALVEGADIIGGGMEFPMVTLMGTYQGRSPRALYNTASHEIGHMWIPMIVGVNEKRYAWLDEGSTSFLETRVAPSTGRDTTPMVRSGRVICGSPGRRPSSP